MEHEERKIAKAYAILTLYTITLLVGGLLLGFAMGRQSVISEREEIHIPQTSHTDTLKVEKRDLLNHIEEL